MAQRFGAHPYHGQCSPLSNPEVHHKAAPDGLELLLRTFGRSIIRTDTHGQHA